MFIFEDVHTSWLYCFINALELGTRVRFRIISRDDGAKAKHVSKVPYFYVDFVVF